MVLDRSAFLSRDDLPREEVVLFESGESVFVRMITGSERDRLEALNTRIPNQDARARLVVFTVCDAEGALLFTEDDIPAVGAKSGATLDRIFAAAIRINRVGQGAIEDATKNSEASR